MLPLIWKRRRFTHNLAQKEKKKGGQIKRKKEEGRTNNLSMIDLADQENKLSYNSFFFFE